MSTSALRLHPETRRHLIKRYALALALAAAALALQVLMHPWVGDRMPFLFFLPALVVASMWIGRGPGLLVLAAGVLSAALSLPPRGEFAVNEGADRLAMALYLLVGLVLVQFGAQLRRSAQRALAAEERLRLAVEDTGIGIFDIDLLTRRIYLSPVLARLAQVPVASESVPLDEWLAHQSAEAVAESRALLIAKLRERASAYERELMFATTAEGHPRWLLLRVHIVWQGDRAVRLRGAGIDITDRKLIDAQLQRTRGELEQTQDRFDAVLEADIAERKRNEQQLHDAERRKDEFLATLAHELRNPLAPIRQAALLSQSPRATEAQKCWSHEVIDRQVRHMALLLDDLLDVSRITRGVLGLRMDQAELATVVDTAIETVRPLIEAKRHRLTVELPAEGVHFDADAMRISQVLANLLGNAAKYTDAGGEIRLSASVAQGVLEIEVADKGIGIAPESLGEIFRMFTQLRGTGERTNSGLGIGLALARGLVALHGGEIAAHSAGPGQGSRFTVRMPLRQGGGDVQGPPATIGAPASSGFKPHKVLIADDNRDAAQSLALLMQLQGHEVTLAFDGREAVAGYRREHADVCLLDIGMPHLNGNEVAQAIRRLPGGDRTLLVAITGWGQPLDRSHSLAAGFDHHLTKPVDPARLAQLLAAHPDVSVSEA